MDNKYTKQFEDQAWQGMKALLDKEMPEKKKRRIPFLLLIPALFLFVSVLSWFGLSPRSSQSVVKDKTEKSIGASSVLKEQKSTDQSITNQVKHLEETSRAENSKEENKKRLASSKSSQPASSSQYSFSTQPLNEISTKVSLALYPSDPVVNESIPSIIEKLPAKPIFKKELKTRPSYKYYFFKPIDIKEIPLPFRKYTFNQEAFTIPTIKNTLAVPSFSLALGGLFKTNIERKLMGPGIALRPTLSYRKLFLEAGIDLFVLKSSFEYGDLRSELVDETEIAEDFMTLNAAQQYISVLESETELNTRLGIGFQLTPKFSMAGGVQVRHILHRKFSNEEEISNVGVNLDPSKETTPPNRYWGPYATIVFAPTKKLQLKVQADYNSPSFLNINSLSENWKRNTFLSAGMLYKF